MADAKEWAIILRSNGNHDMADAIDNLLAEVARLKEESKEDKRLADCFRDLMGMMEATVEAGKHCEGDTRDASKQQLTDAYIDAYKKLKQKYDLAISKCCCLWRGKSLAEVVEEDLAALLKEKGEG